MDIADSLAPTSDQLDAIELVAGPRTFTIESVSKGNAEQPVNVHLAEFPRVWRPSKGMRRVLAAGWGTDATKWVGRRVTLYFDPAVTFGKDRTGGTRISHMSDLPGGKRLEVPLLITRGKSAMFTVAPLTDAPAPTLARAVTREQVTRLNTALTALGITPTDAPTVIADELKRPITALRDLTADELDQAADALERMAGGAS